MVITILIITTMMIMIIIIVKIKIINDDDNNYGNVNDDKGGQTITLFQIMHFRKPLISEKLTFLALTHV